MPSFSQLTTELESRGSTYDQLRRKYVEKMSETTGRNVIVYYSAFFQKTHLRRAGAPGFDVNDNDINGLMATIHQLDAAKGLDLVIHTPGGGFTATEAIVNYLRGCFGTD